MRVTNVIRGKPVYVYKRRQYVYQPDKTFIRKMRYDSDSNTTYVYCNRITVVPELLLISMMVLLVLFNILWLHNQSMLIKYNEYTTYFNGTLYINLTSDESNYYEVNYNLIDPSGNSVAGGTLAPGDSVITLNIPNPEKEYIIRLRYKTLLTEREVPLKIIVVNKDVKSIEGD